LQRSDRLPSEYPAGQTRNYVLYAEETATQVLLILEGVMPDGSVYVSQQRLVTLEEFGETKVVEMALRCDCIGSDDFSEGLTACGFAECGLCEIASENLLNYQGTVGFTDVTIDSVFHCGECGFQCGDVQNVDQRACVAGECGFLECDSGYGDCDSLAMNGCESSLNSAGNCGACGTELSADEICVDGTVEMGEVGCPEGTTNCSGSCVDLLTSTEHCGACGAQCRSTNAERVSCVAGSCDYDCAPGFGNCDESGAGCVESLTLASSCGACDRDCADQPSVVESSCRSTTSGPGELTYYCLATRCSATRADCVRDYPDASGNVPSDVVGCETDTQTDERHCGACKLMCKDDQVCCRGVCCTGTCDRSETCVSLAMRDTDAR